MMKEVNYKINGMSCMHCVMAVKKELSKLELDSTDVQIGSAKIKFDEIKVKQDSIEHAITDAGYAIVK
jgi:copper chaperone